MKWEIVYSDRASVTRLGSYRSWEAGANALYAFCDAWGRNNRGAAGNAAIADWADRQRAYLASAIPIQRKERPRSGIYLGDRERGVTVRLQRVAS